jgi:hypothetical protein
LRSGNDFLHSDWSWSVVLWGSDLVDDWLSDNFVTIDWLTTNIGNESVVIISGV